MIGQEPGMVLSKCGMDTPPPSPRRFGRSTTLKDSMLDLPFRAWEYKDSCLYARLSSLYKCQQRYD